LDQAGLACKSGTAHARWNGVDTKPTWTNTNRNVGIGKKNISVPSIAEFLFTATR
jgi:hypothetical protein